MVKHYMLEEFIELPEKVEVSKDGNRITVAGPKGKVEREYQHPKIHITLKDDGIIVLLKKPKKRTGALFGTWVGHLNNMIKGVTDGFAYSMKIVYAHFPMKVTVKMDAVHIDNFLGETVPRIAKIIGDTKVNVSGDEVSIEGINKEHVGQTAANIEQATHIKGYDPRIFQDGIYIVSKGE